MAYYPFNGNAKDASGNGNDGKISGTTLTKDRHGNAEKAYDFDGVDDYITLPSSIFDEVDGFTLSAWVNINSPSVAHCIISGALAGNDNRLIIGIWVNRFFISYIDQDQYSFPADELMGEWKHIVVTKKSGQRIFTVFVDGLFREKMKYQGGGQLRFAPNGLMIGPDQDLVRGGFQANQLLKGVVDDYRIYNRALSEAEVKELYEFEKPKTQQASTATPPTVVTPTPVKPQPKLSRKNIVGTYERKFGPSISKLVFYNNGFLAVFLNGKRFLKEAKWTVVGGEVHWWYLPLTENCGKVMGINPDGSLTVIGKIDKDGKRTGIPKQSQQSAYIKIK